MVTLVVHLEGSAELVQTCHMCEPAVRHRANTHLDLNIRIVVPIANSILCREHDLVPVVPLLHPGANELLAL